MSAVAGVNQKHNVGLWARIEQEMLAYHRENPMATAQDIAKLFGVSGPTVAKHLAPYGVSFMQVRSRRGEARRQAVAEKRAAKRKAQPAEVPVTLDAVNAKLDRLLALCEWMESSSPRKEVSRG